MKSKHLTHEEGQRLIFYVALVLCVTSAILTVFWVYDSWYQLRKKQQKAFEYAKAQAAIAVDVIDRELSEVVTLVTTIANELTDGELAYQQIEDRLRREVEVHHQLLGLGVAFEPHVYERDSENGLYAPYFIKDDTGQFTKIYVEDSYDYTRVPDDEPVQPNTIWYHQIVTQGAGWIEPFFGTVSYMLLTGYGTPFFRNDPATSKPLLSGIVMATIPLNSLDILIASLKLGPNGYAYMTSQQGLILAHPTKAYIGHVTISEEEQEISESWYDYFSKIPAGQVEGTVQAAWVFWEIIPATGWTIRIVLPKSDFLPDAETVRYQRFRIILIMLICIASFASLVFIVHRRRITGYLR